ncbi:uncharacterized protein LOC127793922 [Diospyros lotus]|uniref:uncharacterized protein LOC127793922 n=1 Tax=Diospyros lotus TaxID=55363 RepID=UPI0022501C70|nr:uncharacterized protein LOC127793922 [Diospyros lotus]
MASSQVEIASSSPFGSVLRDRNRGDQRSLKQTTVQTAFQKSLKALVRTHLQYRPCISSLSPPKHSQKHRQVENFPPQSDDSEETPNLGSVSSLVQRWKQFTATANKTCPNSSSTPVPTATADKTCPNSSSSPVPTPTAPVPISTANSVLAPAGDNPNETERPRVADVIRKQFTDSRQNQSTAKTCPNSSSSPVSTSSAPVPIATTNFVLAPAGDNPKETERPRVADVIRRLTSENQIQSTDHEQTPVLNDFPQFSVSPPRIRGRQAYTSLLMQFERDRNRELDTLLERQAVSKFSHKGRIQAMLRLRFLLGAAAGYQQHSRLMPVGVQRHSRSEAGAALDSHSPAIRDQKHSHNEAAAVSDQHNLGHEAAVEAAQNSSSTAGKLWQCSQNEAAARDQQHSHSMPAESSQPTQGCSAVLLLREKFDVGKENDAVNSRTSQGVVEDKASVVKSSYTSNRIGEETCLREVSTTKQQNTLPIPNSLSDTNGDVHDEISPTSPKAQQETPDSLSNYESAYRCTSSNGGEENKNVESSNGSKEIEKNVESSNGSEENEIVEEQEANKTSFQESENEFFHPRSYWEELEDNKLLQLMEADQEWANEGELDEQEADSHPVLGTNHDWMSDVSRPRSDWETLRQVRYQEMLDPFMDKKEIQQLLEWRSVSTFLCSSLRETMDQLMISRAQRLPTTHNQHEEEEEQDCTHNRLEQLMMSHVQRQTHKMSHRQEEEEPQEQIEEEEEEEEATESVVEYQYGEVDDNEVSNDSDQEGSSLSHQPPPPSSQSPIGGTQSCNSSTKHARIEMELVYDLRAHIELLHQEISELRKTLMNNCLNIQEKLQNSVKQEVAAAVKRSAHGGRKKPFMNGASRKSRCRFCREMQVDSILYRCGHMCACFGCARDLQWSTGKCPICQAPILDVVRVHAGS